MKYTKKINIIIIILIVTGLIFSNYSHASDTSIGGIFSSADSFLTKGDSINNTINESQLQETSNFMYKLLMAIGILVMFIVGTIIGIQYMVASAEDKAKVKESLVPYMVGCFVIFGAFTIWSIAVNIGQDAMSTGAIEITANCYMMDGEWYACGYCKKILEDGDEPYDGCNRCGKKDGIVVKHTRFFCSRCSNELWYAEEECSVCNN